MEKFLKQLDENLIFIKSEIEGKTIKLYCEFKYNINNKVHSRQMSVIKDVPFGNYMVELHLLIKKFFNTDINSEKLTISEKPLFLGSSKRRTKRLDDLIIETCKEMSAIGCERFIRNNIADVSDSTILRMIKKKQH